MKLFTKDVKNSHTIVICLLILLSLNIIIFWDHYFNGIGFPLDFSKAYYARPAFITTLINQGIFPQWVPFQSMGYPISMFSPSGLLYPFFWVFSALSIPYTLQNAITLQNLHVLAGSIGMFFFLNSIIKSPKYSIIGAIAFQFFGGFFSNATYPDMIRAYAISPWMFYVFTLNIEKPNISRKILFIPIVIFVMATGAYPGHFIASIFMMSIFIVLQTLNGFKCRIGKQKPLVIGTVLFSLLILGIVFSIMHLGPIIQYGNELTRFDEDLDPSRYRQFFLNIEHLPYSFLPQVNPNNAEFAFGLYLGLPILVLASFIPIALVKKYWIFFVMFIFAALMAIGKNSFFYEIMTSIVPTLGLTRFSISEYSIFLAVPLFVFGIIGLKAIIDKKINLKSYVLRTAFIISWFSYGIFSLYSNYEILKWKSIDALNQQIVGSIVILAILILAIGIIILKSKKNYLFIKNTFRMSIVLVVFFSGLIIVEGFMTISENPRWKLDPFDAYYKKFDFQLEKNGKLSTFGILENLPNERPQRELTTGKTDFIWKGYLDGSYIMRDLPAGTILLKDSQTAILEQYYRHFLRQSWTPLLIDIAIENSETKISLPQSFFKSSYIKKINQTSVNQTHYGINDIDYQVSLTEPKLMIENEIYFPGWTATLIYPDKEIQLQAIEVNDVFRAWALPAGDYEMKANFEFPNYTTYQIISLSAFIIWIIILIVFVIRIKKNPSLPN